MWGGMGWLCGVWCVWWVWLFVVLHMGGQGLCGVGGWFLLELRAFLASVMCGGWAPMCGEGGLRTWEQDHSRHQNYFSA